jgi:hypothetical protein
LTGTAETAAARRVKREMAESFIVNVTMLLLERDAVENKSDANGVETRRERERKYAKSWM